MTNQETLEKAIRQAVGNGWKPMMWVSLKEQKEATAWLVTSHTIRWSVSGNYPKFSEDAFRLIFDHNFAKALWGESTDVLIVQNNSLNLKQVIDMNGWRYHLQRMVIADDPIKYLESVL